MPNQTDLQDEFVMPPEQFRRRILEDYAFMEGISYALSEEAGKKLRHRLNTSWCTIKKFLEDNFVGEEDAKVE